VWSSACLSLLSSADESADPNHAYHNMQPATHKHTNTHTRAHTHTQVRTVTVETRRVALSELRVPPQQTTEISSVEASLRLDAVASAGVCGLLRVCVGCGLLRVCVGWPKGYLC